ncbi:MAG: LysR family hydrogen peroxide-inducible transcriptional activator [Paracoccaceae bacterium]|jgi:LysR family hydrogen peroxide-inducible transcriptional activator
MPTLQQFRYLVAIADTLHFRRAAEINHVTQPTLSGQLRELERKLGVQLVERSRARVVLTPIGKEITARARVVLRDAQEIVNLAKHGQTLLGGTVRLGILPSLGPYLLPHILPDLRKAYPDLRLYIREAIPQDLLTGLDEGTLDLLIYPLPVRGSDFDTAALFREPLLLAAPHDHRLTLKSELNRADLAGETILALAQGHRLHDQVRDLCEQYNANLSLDYEGTSLDTLRHMVAMGMGLTFLPSLYVDSEIKGDGQIATLPFKTRPPSRLIGMVWRNPSSQKDDFLALADLLRGILRLRTKAVNIVN